MFDPILQQPELITGSVALIVIAIVLYKSGLLHELANKMADNGSRTNDRLQDLEEFMNTAESNHFTDLEEVMTEVKDLRTKVNKMDNRLVRVETKLDNYHKQ